MAGRKISGVYIPLSLDTSNVQKDMEDLGRSLGTVIDSIQKKFDGALNTKDLANNIVKVTRAMGDLRDSANALGQLNGVNIFKDKMGALPSALRNVAEAFGGTVQQQRELYSQLVKTQAIDQQVKALETLQRATKLTSAEIVNLARVRGATLSSEAVSQFLGPSVTAAAGTTTKEGRGLAGIFTPSSISAGAQSALAATGVVTGMYGITELVKSSYQATMRMDNLNLSFESIYGSAAKAGAQLDFVKKVSDDLGLSFTDTAEGAKKLFAAARGTEVEKDANQIFKAFSTMGAALKLTGDETNSVFLAVSQMISKGKVSAEELRLQLAERMPGAVTLFAKAIGVTTKELDQMLQNGQVGLDSLRKFALEVEKTYAAGAAGAAKGMQAELNRVSTAWFFLKQAFVDSKGTAEALSVVSSALKTITEYAPQIAAVGSALLKIGVAAAGVYAIARSLAALSAAFAALQTASGAIALRASVASLISPLGAATAVAAGLVAAVWSITPAHEAAAKAIGNVTFNIDEYGKAAKDATDKVKAMNEETRKGAVERAGSAFEVSMAKFSRFGSSDLPDTAMGTNPMYSTKRMSAFSSSLQDIKATFGFGPTLQNALLTEGQALGDQFTSIFFKALKRGASQDELDEYVKIFATNFQKINDAMEKGGVSPEVIKRFKEITNTLFEAATGAKAAKEGYDGLKDGLTAATDNLKTFSNAYDSILKVTKETELGKQLTYQSEAKGAAKQLVDMVPAVEAARAKIEELKGQNAENNKELAAAQDVIEKNSNAFTLLGQAAIKSKMDLTTLQEGIRLAGVAAGLTKDQIEALQKQAEKGFRIGAIQTMGELGAELDVEKLMAGASAGQKKTLSVFQKYAKDETQKLEMAKAIRKGSVEGLTIALKDPSVNQEDIASIWKKAMDASAAVDTESAAKKAQSNWQTINTAIRDATKTLESWQGKVNESKADQFSASVKAEADKIGALINSGKANASQLTELRKLQDDILRTGAERAKQIQYEQEREQSKEMTRYRTRITAGYKKLEGVDNIESYAAAKGQYEDDVKFFQHALDEKRISQEDFNNYMMMLNRTLADAQLRSQTDMFSRLKVAANDYYKKYGDFTRNIGDVVTTAMDSSAKAIAAFARSGASDFASLANAFAKMADSILENVTNLLAQQAVSGMWKGLSSFFNSGSIQTTGASSSWADFGVTPGASMPLNANGNVFSGGNLSAYSGSIVSSPTLFSAGTKVPAYATGAGLMGEAGPEGIFPLTRVNGKLGVRAEMGQSQPTVLNQAVNVNVNNASGAQVTTQQTKDNQGNISIEVMIEEAVGKSMRRPGSSPYKSLQTNFGARQQLASV